MITEYVNLPAYAQRAIRNEYEQQCRATYNDLYDDVVDDFLKRDDIAILLADHMEDRFREFLDEADRDGTWDCYVADLHAP